MTDQDRVAEAERLDMRIKLVAFDHETADCLLRHLENSAPCNGEPREFLSCER